MPAGEAFAGHDGGERGGHPRPRRPLAAGPCRGERRQARGVADGFRRGHELAETLGRRALEGVAQVEPGEPAAAGGERVVGGAQGQRPAGAFGVGAGGPLAMAQREDELVQRGQAALRPRLADQPLHGERIAAGIGGHRFDLRGAGDASRAGDVLDGTADPRVRVVAEPCPHARPPRRRRHRPARR